MKNKIPFIVGCTMSVVISLTWVTAWSAESKSARSGVTHSARPADAERGVANRSSRSESEELAVRMQGSLSSVTPENPFVRDPGEVTFTSCMPCHGTQGEGDRAVFAPPLAGQAPWYMDRQLEHFRRGIRGGNPKDVHGAVMHPLARLLANADAQASILETIAEFPVPDPPVSIEGDLEAGAEIYETLCMRCHGPQGEGNQDEQAPRLNILPDWYIIRQLENFQAGFRGAHEADASGQEMRPMALSVMEANQKKNVAAYIQSLDSEAAPKQRTDRRSNNSR